MHSLMLKNDACFAWECEWNILSPMSELNEMSLDNFIHVGIDALKLLEN